MPVLNNRQEDLEEAEKTRENAKKSLAAYRENRLIMLKLRPVLS